MRPDTRVLLMSGHTDEVFAEKEGGPMYPLMQKLFTPEALARRLRAILDA